MRSAWAAMVSDGFAAAEVGRKAASNLDVEVQVAGLSFVIVGVQVRHGSDGLSARLPTDPWSRCRKSCSGRSVTP
jgi:hypothetical protein